MATPKTIERSVQDLIDATDDLIGAVIAEIRYPMDTGMRMQTKSCRDALREAWIRHLIVCGLVE